MKQTFEEVRNFLSNIPYINRGGCGVAALSMYRWLEKGKREIPKIVLLYPDYSTYKENKEGLRQENTKLKAPLHCAIKYRDKIIDSTEEIVENIYSFQQIVGKKEILKLINKGKWNNEFNREENIPLIERTLAVDLSDVCLEPD